ncbi:MAG: DUF971 domain-containing protein [Rhodospirillaceae bacterium]|nr:DUF971 domain-containing protein [Rhodospirillaceae bacterium]
MSGADTGNTDSQGTQHWPVEIRHRQAKKLLEIEFDDGRTFTYPAELLRVESPSAEVQGHGPGQKTLVPGRRHVGIMNIEPVGHYAIRLQFDDLHDTGIYSWRYLYELGLNQDRVWADYLAALARQGLSRDPGKAPAHAHHDHGGGCGHKH